VPIIASKCEKKIFATQPTFQYTREELSEVLKLPEEVYNKIFSVREYPDESFNAVVFRLICIDKALKASEVKL
jgi:hypothetical protein